MNLLQRIRKKSKGELTRLRIIEIATDLFLKEGFYNVTFLKVSQEAKLSAPALYKYFESMEDLFLESCIHWLDTSRLFINEEPLKPVNGKLQLKQYIDRHIEYASANRSHDALLFGLYYHSLQSPKMLEVYQALKVGAVNKIKLMLELGNQDQSLTAINPELLADTIHSLVVGEVIKSLIDPKKESFESSLKRIHQFLGGALSTSFSN